MRHQRSADSGSVSDAPSKSQLKRDSHALQVLGAQLLELSEEKLEKLPLDERLLDAIRLAKTIRAREGLRRQIQYIGRLMRDSDAEAIRLALEGDQLRHRADTALMHAAEHWRERLLADPGALEQWLGQHPLTRDALTATLAAALAEHAVGQRGRHYRELFRLLRDTLHAATAVSVASSGPEA
jgi:ribosome-associated protein